MAFSSWFDRSLHGPLVIAHRGGAALAAENTVAAFDAAREARADAMETDVRATADGVLVCVHDADLQRLCGDPRAVSDLDLANLRQLLPDLLTLDEAIEVSAPLGLLLDVKLIDSRYLPAIFHAIKAGGAIERTIVGLRQLELVGIARKMESELAILAFAADPDSAPEAARLGATWFRLWQGAANEARIAAARGAGLQVVVMVGQPRSVPIDEYPPFPVGLIDAEGLADVDRLRPDAILLDDPRLLRRRP